MYFTRQTAKRLKLNSEIRDRLYENGYIATMVPRYGGWVYYDPVDHEENFDRRVEDWSNDEIGRFAETRSKMRREMYLDAEKLEKMYPVVFMEKGMKKRMRVEQTRIETMKLSWIYEQIQACGVAWLWVLEIEGENRKDYPK